MLLCAFENALKTEYCKCHAGKECITTFEWTLLIPELIIEEIYNFATLN